MHNNSILVRPRDKKEFRVVYLAHWTDIKADDGERDTVKWIGPNVYVGQRSGALYVELVTEPVAKEQKRV